MSTIKDTKTLLDFFFKSSDSMQSFWNYYLAVVIGLIAFSASTTSKSLFLIIIVTIAFIIFGIVNLSGIRDLNGQRTVSRDQIKRNAEEGDELAKLYLARLNPPTFTGVIIFHVILDISTLSVLWTLFLTRQ